MPPEPAPRRRIPPLDPDAWRFLIPLAAVAVVGLVWEWPVVAILAAALMIAVATFFRDPHRVTPGGPADLVSPADGKVVFVGPNTDPERGPVPGTRVTVFLSVLNCHINRAPCAGTVRSVRHKPGLFLNALDEESTDRNECNWVFLDTAWGTVSVRQIAGLIARRIVCRVAPGTPLARGERFGLIRFGSRTEIYLPEGAEVKVAVGQKVKGSVTILARMPEPTATGSASS